MIIYEDQSELFKVIALNLKRDISCFAFGGTAMLFYGYKDETKDIDILFQTHQDRNDFTSAIKTLGFEETSPIKVYIPEKLRDKNRPVMYILGDIRFDLFVEKIFRTQLSPKMKADLFAVHTFSNKHNLTLFVFRKEHIVQLKAITERDKDLEDMLTILKADKGFNWQYLIDEVIWQYMHGNSWALLDTERIIKELKKYLFIEKKYLDQLYKAQK